MKPLPLPLRRRLDEDGRDLTIVVVRLGALGDIVRTLPGVRLVRFALPDARIAWACDDRWAPVLASHEDIDDVVALPRRFLREAARNPGRWPGALRELARFRGRLVALDPDLALDFQGNVRSGCVALASGAPVRIGYAGHQQKEGNRWLTTHRVAPGPRRRSRVERNLDLVRALGLPDGPLPSAGLRLPREASMDAVALLRDLGCAESGFAVINPGASARQAYKKPPAELLASAARRVDAAGIVPVVVHGPGEEEDARRVVDLSGGVGRFAPRTELFVLLALLRRARLFVGGDSGPLHCACAVGCPVVGVYGPTDPVVNAPWGGPHRVVHPDGRAYTGIKRVDRANGFEGLGSDAVDRAIVELLAEVRAAPA